MIMIAGNIETRLSQLLFQDHRNLWFQWLDIQYF